MHFLAPGLSGPSNGWILGDLVKCPGSGVTDGIIKM